MEDNSSWGDRYMAHRRGVKLASIMIAGTGAAILLLIVLQSCSGSAKPPKQAFTATLTRTATGTATPQPTQTPPGIDRTAVNILPTLSAGGTEVGAAASTTPPPQSTQTGKSAQSPSQTPVIVASVPLIVRNVSGEIIGDGTLRLFAPDDIHVSQSARVELELQMNHRYLTPTPEGNVYVEPVTPITSTPRPGQSTPTPRVPVYVESGETLYERMGASLRCLPSSFEGCDGDYKTENLQRIDTDQVIWSWRIKPLDGVLGWQDLEVELWTLEIAEGVPAHTVRWSHAFQDPGKSAGSEREDECLTGTGPDYSSRCPGCGRVGCCPLY